MDLPSSSSSSVQGLAFTFVIVRFAINTPEAIIVNICRLCINLINHGTYTNGFSVTPYGSLGKSSGITAAHLIPLNLMSALP